MKELTEFQQNAISELLTIGLGRAAVLLSEIVEDNLNLSVSSVELQTTDRVIGKIKATTGENIVAIRENLSFEELFLGRALLIFYEDHSIALLRALFREDSIPLEVLLEMEQEALTEAGNIILNACLGSLVSILNHNLIFQLPQFIYGRCTHILSDSGILQSTVKDILIFQINFSLQQANIDGYLTLLLDISTMESLIKQLDLYFGVTN